jgi:hypothetical protein
VKYKKIGEILRANNAARGLFFPHKRSTVSYTPKKHC